MSLTGGVVYPNHTEPGGTSEWGPRWTGDGDNPGYVSADDPERWNAAFDRLFSEVDGAAAEPFRLKVQKCLAFALHQIIPANGFYCDLSNSSQVQRGRMSFDDTDLELGTVVSILEEPFAFDEDLAPSEGITRDEPYELILQGFTSSLNPVYRTDPAHFLLSDLKRRLAGLKRDEDRGIARLFRFGSKTNSVLSIRWDGGVVRPDEAETPFAMCWLRVAFGVSEDNLEPAG